MKCKHILVAFALSVTLGAQGQNEGYPFTALSLSDMKAFKPQAGNWRIAGGASAHPDKKLDLQATPGTGILVNLPDGQKKDDLFTLMEHGDIELELEFMTARESNSGIYLMGRYELQILDSHTRTISGSLQPGKHDCAAIYERWDESKPEGQKGYEGHPPLVNVTRAPGLWQKYHIIFQAPRFNEKGEKIANAKFVRVIHNGVVVHENVELTGPTRGSAFEQEAALGPLCFQGDHGPVAFRNIRYRLYNKAPLKVENVTAYRYDGTFDKALPDWKTLQPAAFLPAPDGITWQVNESNDPCALVFSGTVTIVEPGSYFFGLDCNGAGSISVNGRKLVEKTGENVRGNIQLGKIDLKPGKYPLQVVYAKWIPWQAHSLGVYAEGPGIARHELHALGSVPQIEARPIMYVRPPDSRPYVLRAFIQHNNKQYPHAVSVGFGSQINYAVDLNQGKWLSAWRGEFLDAAPIWHSRGGGNVIPLGSVIDLQPAPIAAVLPTEQSPFPDSTDVTYKGWVLDSQGIPTFRYLKGNATVTDRISPEEGGKALHRTLNISGASANTYVRLARGTISKVEEGLFLVNGEYYLLLPAGQQANLRSIDNRSELIWKVPAEGKGEFSYRIMF